MSDRTKEELRASVRAWRRECDPDWVERVSARIQAHVARLASFRRASCVGLYLPMRGEVRVSALCEQCWRDGKRVCVPAFDAMSGRYGLAAWERDTRSVAGHGRVREPEQPVWVAPEVVDWIAVPGLAFDAMGGRVGHGRGHYDALLARTLSACFKVGLAFDAQVFEKVPRTAHDVRLDALVTETRVLVIEGLSATTR